MSHLVSLQTKVHDPATVAAACQRLNLAPPQHGTAQLYSGEAEGLLVQLPDWQYPIVIDTLSGVARQRDRTTSASSINFTGVNRRAAKICPCSSCLSLMAACSSALVGSRPAATMLRWIRLLARAAIPAPEIAGEASGGETHCANQTVSNFRCRLPHKVGASGLTRMVKWLAPLVSNPYLFIS
jgi:hypothetical protein